jgi:hypothetical protein
VTRKLIAFFVLALLALPAAAGARGYAPAGFIGIAPQNPLSDSDFELMEKTGIESVRLPMYWPSIQPQNPSFSLSDWAAFDRSVELSAEHGIRVFPFLLGSPEWVAPEWIDVPVRTAWQRWAWSDFLREAAARYGPGGDFWEENSELPALPIRKWEIWNEQNIVTFAGNPDPAGFAKLIRISGRILHRADPGAQVIVGGLFGLPLQTPPNVRSGDFLSQLYRARPIKRFFDGIALHPYVARASAMRAQISNLRRIMRVHRDASTPLYVTEMGWGSDSNESRWERGLYGQADELSRAFSLLFSHRHSWRIGWVWWFSWIDQHDACQFCDSAGLLTEDREAKPSWYRFNEWTGGDPDTVPRASFEN